MLIGLLGACKPATKMTLPDLQDAPIVEAPRKSTLSETVPGYGILVGNHFEVNIEAADSAQVKVGQAVRIYAPHLKNFIPATVSQIIRGVSRETGQSIAWLKPMAAPSAPPPILPGDFVYATITVGKHVGVLTVPKRAVLVRDGKSWVIKQVKDEKGKTSFSPAEVVPGISDSELLEIKSGLVLNDQIVSQGGVGFLFPDFKAQGEGD